MNTTILQSVLAWLSVSLGFLAGVVLIVLLLVQVLLDAYHSPAPVKYPQWTQLSTAVLLVAFGIGMLLRILQLQGSIGP